MKLVRGREGTGRWRTSFDVPSRTRHATPAARARPEPVLGRYQLHELIGQGATARVYRASDRRTGGEVALKEIVLQEGLARRVRAEVRAAARLSHRSIARLLDWGQEGPTVYLAWELVDGPSLAELLMRSRPPGPVRMLRIVADVLDGLAHAHSRGVVHRDVKPANVLVGSDGRARLADFGVARLVDEGRLTRSGVTVGTMAYMAPEQAMGIDATGATDVYAACLVLFEGLTGRNPLATGNPAETARRAAAADLPDLADERPDLPRRVLDLVASGLVRDPAARPTASALGRALREEARRMSAPSAARPPMLAMLARGAGAVAAFMAMVAVLTGMGMPGLAALAALGVTATLATLIPRLACVVAFSALVGLLLGALAPAIALGAVAGVALGLPMRGHPALLLVPAVAPIAFASGAGVLYCLLAGSIRGQTRRAWAAAAGAFVAISVQLWLGASGLLFSPETRMGLGSQLGDGHSIRGAVAAISSAITDRPDGVVGLVVVVVASLTLPRVVAQRGGAQALAMVAWMGFVVLTAGLAPGSAGVGALLTPIALSGLAGVAAVGLLRRPGGPAPRASGTLKPVR